MSSWTRAIGALAVLDTVLAAAASGLFVLKVAADVTIPGLYLQVLPEIPDGVKVGLLWIPAGILVSAWRRSRRTAQERSATARRDRIGLAALLVTALAGVATVLLLAGFAGITIPGAYVSFLPEVPDSVKVGLLWIPALVLFAVWRRSRPAAARPADPPVPEIDPPAGEDGGPIAVVRNVVKVYETGPVRVDALRGIDMEVRRGEMLAIVGPSGCGKTTLLNCLSSIDEVTEGEVIIAGRRLSDISDSEKSDFRAERIGFVFQAYNLIPVLRVVENVELPLLILGEDPKAARAKALGALRSVGLTDEANRRPSELSGGQQQRVAIARALVNRPTIVFADEPTGNLDSETTQEVVALLKQLNKESGQTFVLVTHDPNVARIADRIIAMRSGRIEKVYRPTEF
jgi:putative ABC transport system ATP-binding protein